MRLRGGRVSTNTLRLPRRGCSAARRRKSGASWKKNPSRGAKESRSLAGWSQGRSFARCRGRTGGAGEHRRVLLSRSVFPSKDAITPEALPPGKERDRPLQQPRCGLGGAAGLALPSPRPPFPLITASPSEQPLLSAFLCPKLISTNNGSGYPNNSPPCWRSNYHKSRRKC